LFQGTPTSEDVDRPENTEAVISLVFSHFFKWGTPKIFFHSKNPQGTPKIFLLFQGTPTSEDVDRPEKTEAVMNLVFPHFFTWGNP